MERQGRRAARPRRLAGALGVLAALLVLAACSSGSDSKVNLGLAGATSDHPATPPQIAANGPDLTYAFVYDNQIWLHLAHQSGAKQLTHLVLSSGAAITWGPLVWSPNGKYIAFALVENLNPAVPSRASGPVYIVDADPGDSTNFGSVQNTAATGSIHGHTYDWFDDTMLFYSTGGGVMMYGPINIPGADPRVWPAVTQFGQQQGPEGRTVSGQGLAWGDITLTDTYLYYTLISFGQGAPLGVAGQVGTAQVCRAYLKGLPPDADLKPSDVLQYFPLTSSDNPCPDSRMDLGQAYADQSGNLVAGAWQVTGDGDILIAQRITGVDVKKGVVHATYCTADGGCGGVLGAASSFPLAVWPNAALSPKGTRVAFTSDALYVGNYGGGGDGKLAGAGWTTPPAWSGDGKQIAVTQLVGQSTDAEGVPHVQTNVVLYGGGSNSLVLVPGGQNLAWQP